MAKVGIDFINERTKFLTIHLPGSPWKVDRPACVCCFSRLFSQANPLVWHIGAIKAQEHIGGYGRSSHMIDNLPF